MAVVLTLFCSRLTVLVAVAVGSQSDFNFAIYYDLGHFVWLKTCT